MRSFHLHLICLLTDCHMNACFHAMTKKSVTLGFLMENFNLGIAKMSVNLEFGTSENLFITILNVLDMYLFVLLH